MKFKVLILMLAFATTVMAEKKVDYNKYNNFYYNVYDYDSDHTDTSTIVVERVGNMCVVYNPNQVSKPVPGLARELTLADYVHDSLTFDLMYDTIVFRSSRQLSRSDIEWTKEPLTKTRTRFTCYVNSNKLEFVVEASHHCINPLPQYGLQEGVLVEYWRNGQLQIQLNKWDDKASSMMLKAFTPVNLTYVTAAEQDRIKRERLVISTRIFDQVQLSWGQQNDSASDLATTDKVLHFAGGTLAMRRVHLQALPPHYQTFVEIHQRSNGDAYDRTGSLFVIPHRMYYSFLDGLNDPKNLSTITDRLGQQYQGVVKSKGYEPLVELVRFFTPFGVGKFNEKVAIEGLEWNDETYYKQEVTDMAEMLQGDVWIGIWIGNYDKGGHIVSVDLKSYPGEDVWRDAGIVDGVMPLFNTCNVLEMAGQNYGKMFLTDSLQTTFEIPQGAKSIRLRYITTGHGGWGGGDEFNPKSNTILVDGVKVAEYTPWREDCGCYREWNPVSGNFWNGLSSSDYSRSGWCPGTATQPVYFDLSGLEPGTHTITVAIPQGKPMEGSFSAWNVSGALIIGR